MITYSEELVNIVKDETHTSFINNCIKRLAVERLLEIIGEAANHISKEVIENNEDIPWSKIIGLRNKVAHDYGEILTDRIWLIATRSIPELLEQIKSKNFL